MEIAHQSNHWPDYELIDCGDFEKLERFGSYVLIRPEPQAVWSRKLSSEEWKKLAHARFDREQKDKFRFSEDVQGGWTIYRNTPDHWNIEFPLPDFKFTFKLALTNFGHTGIFPEQSFNWTFIHEQVSKSPGCRVLNLFAYTGIASVVAKQAGADVTHVDAARPSINWANQNMQINNLSDIRWVFEDALKFVKREIRRGNKYHGIIMDPPPYGRGAKGEKWILQEQLNELFGLASALLEPTHSFFIMSMYATNLSSITGRILAESHFGKISTEYGEFCLKASRGNDLPMGSFLRFAR